MAIPPYIRLLAHLFLHACVCSSVHTYMCFCSSVRVYLLAHWLPGSLPPRAASHAVFSGSKWLAFPLLGCSYPGLAHVQAAAGRGGGGHASSVYCWCCRMRVFQASPRCDVMPWFCLAWAVSCCCCTAFRGGGLAGWAGLVRPCAAGMLLG